MFQFRQALVRMRAGDTVREVARSGLMGRDKLTELRAVAEQRGWLDAGLELPDDPTIVEALGPRKRAASTVSSVEPLRELVQRWLDAGVQGKAIHAALRREHGFAGSYSSVVRMLRRMRAAQPADVTVRLSFAPGEAAQVDFGAGPVLVHPEGQPRRTWAFVMTLCHSRHQYVEFVWDQTVATWLGCHRRAFEWFVGVPERLIIDNAKCAVIKACRHDPVVQRAYAECAEGYGFKIDPCPPHDPQKTGAPRKLASWGGGKGVVESGVKYLKGNFLPTRSFRDLADLNAQARAWVMAEAGTRRHGTTHAQPLALFELERALLQPLPAVAPDLGTWHRAKLHRDCHVQFQRSYYSAPYTLVGRELWLRATDNTVALYEDWRHVYTHLRSQRPGQRMTLRDHLPPEARTFFERDRNWCLGRAAQIGPCCTALVQTLLAERIVERLRSVQALLGKATPYGAARLEAACARALLHDSPHYRTVKSILATGADLQPEILPHTPAAYTHSRYTRSAAELFDNNTAGCVH